MYVFCLPCKVLIHHSEMVCVGKPQQPMLGKLSGTFLQSPLDVHVRMCPCNLQVLRCSQA